VTSKQEKGKEKRSCKNEKHFFQGFTEKLFIYHELNKQNVTRCMQPRSITQQSMEYIMRQFNKSTSTLKLFSHHNSAVDAYKQVTNCQTAYIMMCCTVKQVTNCQTAYIMMCCTAKQVTKCAVQ
jgi:hypothetical protein